MLDFPFFAADFELGEEGGDVLFGGGTVFDFETEITCALIVDGDCGGATVGCGALGGCCRSFHALV